MNIYQISFKFRDEFRPRFGVLRSREFIMKDSYSFHTDPESLDETYQVMYDTYCRIFKRCGLDYVIVEAESGLLVQPGSVDSLFVAMSSLLQDPAKAKCIGTKAFEKVTQSYSSEKMASNYHRIYTEIVKER